MKFLDRVHHFFFPEGSSLRLGISRLIFFGLFFYFYGTHYHFVTYNLLPESMQLHRGLMTLLPHPGLSLNQWLTLHDIWSWVLLAAAVGFMGRFTVPLAAASTLVIIGWAQSYAYFTHTFMPLVLCGIILACSKSSESFSIDWLIRKWRNKSEPLDKRSEEYGWPVVTAQVVFCLVFFAAGISKIRNGGLDWVTSDSLQNMLLRSYLYYHDSHSWATSFRLNEWLASKPWLCHIAAASTIFIEVGIISALFVRGKLRFAVIATLIAFQTAIYFTIFVNFRVYLCIYLFWIPWDQVAIRMASWLRLPLLWMGSLEKSKSNLE